MDENDRGKYVSGVGQIYPRECRRQIGNEIAGVDVRIGQRRRFGKRREFAKAIESLGYQAHTAAPLARQHGHSPERQRWSHWWGRNGRGFLGQRRIGCGPVSERLRELAPPWVRFLLFQRARRVTYPDRTMGGSRDYPRGEARQPQPKLLAP